MAGLSVSTNKLTVSAWDFFPARAEFVVSNPNPEHVAVRLDTEGDAAGWLKLSEQNLVLAPNESKEITARIAARRGGEFHPMIAIAEQALEGPELGIAAGVKLPVEIHSRAITGPLLGAILILLLLVTIKLFRKQRTNNT